MGWETVIYMVIAAVISIALAPKPPKPKAATLDDFDLPTAEEGRPVPVVFGTLRVAGPNVLWYGDLRSKAIKKSGLTGSTTVGYKYYLGIHFGICHGPIDAILKIDVGEKVAWSGSQTANGAITIANTSLFGGQKKEGGLEGVLDVCLGASSQTANAYLSAKIGGTIPAFRGVVGLVWRDAPGTGGGYIGTTAYPKPWAFTVRRILQGWAGGSAWYSAKATIGAGNANAAHIVYEALTNPEWGMGLPSATLDAETFENVADTLYTEGFGLSLMWNREGSVEEFIQAVLDHVAGILSFNRATGKYELSLIRGDYDPGTLPEYGPDKILEVSSYQRQAWGETTNELSLTYTDPATLKATSVTVHDLANIASQGTRISKKLEMRGITSADIAQKVAARELQAISTPLAKLSIAIDRSGWSQQQGDVIRITWPQLGLAQIVVRILSIRIGTLTENALQVEAVEDVFGMPSSVYTAQPSPGADPGPPTLEELPDEPGASVISATTTAPPALPVDGDRYLIPAGATGAWVGHVGEAAIWDEESGAWTFELPSEGTIVYVEDTGTRVETVPGSSPKVYSGGGGYPAQLGYAGI